MKKIPEIVRFHNLDSIGEITNQKYFGSFRLKVILTHSERFAIERAYKSILPDDKGVDPAVSLRAAGISELEQRIVEAPKWWIDSRNGRDLVDSQPIYDLIVAVNELYEKWRSELNTVAEDASSQ